MRSHVDSWNGDGCLAGAALPSLSLQPPWAQESTTLLSRSRTRVPAPLGSGSLGAGLAGGPRLVVDGIGTIKPEKYRYLERQSELEHVPGQLKLKQESSWSDKGKDFPRAEVEGEAQWLRQKPILCCLNLGAYEGKKEKKII